MVMVVVPFVENLTTNYHNSGGLVIVAKSEERVLEMWYEYADKTSDEGRYPIRLDEEELEKAVWYKLDPNVPTQEMMYVFPDAGCC